MKVLLVGVGGVGEAIAAIAKPRAWMEQMVLADYNVKRAEEVQKKISELQSVELWLSFNLQMVQSQLAVLEQQKLFFNSLNQMSENLSTKPD